MVIRKTTLKGHIKTPEEYEELDVQIQDIRRSINKREEREKDKIGNNSKKEEHKCR